MKIAKIKNKKIMKTVLYGGVCFALGYGTCVWVSPDYSAMMRPNEVPYVSVQELSYKDMSEKTKFIAQAEAVESVDIIPQINGYLDEVRFQDGSYVKEGDVLFVIEQKKFKANVDAAAADLDKAKSDLVQLESDYKRKKQLYAEKYISASELEVAENKFTQANAAIRQAQANLELAEINLGYTEIKAPISGFIGKSLITKGNYVHPSIPSLARIVKTDPIRIAFSVSDKERLTFLQNLKDKRNNISFEIAYPTGETEPIEIDQIFTGNEINPDTATIPIYIDYKNPHKKLLPGTFVDVLVVVGQQDKVLTVPLTALAQDSNGTYVIVIDNDNKAEQRYVETGEISGVYQEVKSGLNENDRVVVQGLQKVSAGMTVHPVIVNGGE